MVKATQKSSTKSPKISRGGNPSSVKTSDGKPTMEELLQSTGYNIPILRRGQEVVGRVISLTHSEMLLDIGAKSEGIIFGKELNTVHDIVSKIQVGDEIDAVVVYPENDAGQVVLSLRKLSSDKRWAELDDKKETEESFDVVAVEANKGGLICEWMGIRGFLPASQLATQGGPASQGGPSRIEDLIGKTLSVRVIELDRNTNRLIFSQKSTDVADLAKLQALLAKIKIGDKYQGTVTAVLPFGVFVEIGVDSDDQLSVVSSQLSDTSQSVSQSTGSETGKQKTDEPISENRKQITNNRTKLEGLVHISEISWEKVDDPTSLFKVGQKVDVMVVSMEQSLGRLNLSIKQLAHDPFTEISEKYTHDLVVKGTIARITPSGAYIDLDEGLEGHVPVSKIPQTEPWDAGQAVECLVESVDVKARKINLVPVAKKKPVLYR